MATSDQTIMTKPTLDLVYQDGTGGFKILTADHMGCAIQLYRNLWHWPMNWMEINIRLSDSKFSRERRRSRINADDRSFAMLSEKAVELAKELTRSGDGSIPTYNEDGVRQVLDEMYELFKQNQKDVTATLAGESGRLPVVQVRHNGLLRDRRCLLAYLYNRMEIIRDMRWDIGSVLPMEVRKKLIDEEINWFVKYNQGLAQYIEAVGIDVTQHSKPPKSLYIEVRCLVDYGEFENEDGTLFILKKNSQHLLPRDKCEHLVRQGVLEHIIWWSCCNLQWELPCSISPYKSGHNLCTKCNQEEEEDNSFEYFVLLAITILVYSTA